MSGLKNKVIMRVIDSLQRKIVNSFCKKDIFLDKNFKVLMFHDVDGAGDYSMKKTDFFNLLEKFIILGFEFIDLAQVVRCKNKKELSKKLLVTFDDGFESTFSIAYPFLKEKKIPFCLFVTTSFLNQTGYLNDAELLLMANDPLCIVGSHFVNHVMSRYISRDMIIREVKESFELLLNKFGVKDRVIALPYGSIYSCSKKDLRIIKKTGVSCIFTTMPSINNEINIWSLGRIDASKLVSNLP